MFMTARIRGIWHLGQRKRDMYSVQGFEMFDATGTNGSGLRFSEYPNAYGLRSSEMLSTLNHGKIYNTLEFVCIALAVVGVHATMECGWNDSRRGSCGRRSVASGHCRAHGYHKTYGSALRNVGPRQGAPRTRTLTVG